MRVLALIPGGLSQQFLFLPTLDALKHRYPHAEVDVVAEPIAVTAYQVSQTVNRVIPFSFSGRKGGADWVNLLGTTRDREYDVGLAASSDRWNGLLLWMMGIETRIGFAGRSNFLLTQAIPVPAAPYSTTTYHKLLQGLGITAPCPELKVSVSPADIAWAASERQRLGLSPDQGYILIDGGLSQSTTASGTISGYNNKDWQKIFQGIEKQQPDISLVMVQDPAERAGIVAMRQEFPQLLVTAPENVGKLAALLMASNLVLCRAGVLMYLAAAVQAYAAVLFRDSDPEHLLPTSDRLLKIKSATDSIGDISPTTILQKIWGGLPSS
jgi:ADP-heptose:LPS heptosyltransferase